MALFTHLSYHRSLSFHRFASDSVASWPHWQSVSPVTGDMTTNNALRLCIPQYYCFFLCLVISTMTFMHFCLFCPPWLAPRLCIYSQGSQRFWKVLIFGVWKIRPWKVQKSWNWSLVIKSWKSADIWSQRCWEIRPLWSKLCSSTVTFMFCYHWQ